MATFISNFVTAVKNCPQNPSNRIYSLLFRRFVSIGENLWRKTASTVRKLAKSDIECQDSVVGTDDGIGVGREYLSRALRPA